MTVSPPQPLFLALDGGGTKTRAVLSRKTQDGGAEVVSEAVSAGSNLAEVSTVAFITDHVPLADCCGYLG